jgi:hypothetical protein
MPNKARNKRRQEEEEAAESRRRRAQSQRDKARNRREQDERINSFTHAVQRYLALNRGAVPPAANPPSIAVPEEDPSCICQASIMEARSDKFMRNIAQYVPLRYMTTLTNKIRLFTNMKHSDATVLIYEKPLPVHKSVICTQSAYFEKVFEEKRFVEGSAGVLTFNNGSGAAHWRIFEYLYTGDYSDDLSNDFEGEVALITHALNFLTATRRLRATERPSSLRSR